VDAKAPLAAMIAVATKLLNENFTGKVIVIGAVDEEGMDAELNS